MQTQEVFTVSGVAPDVRYARAAAWNGLREILGGEPEDEWQQGNAQYQLAEVAADDTPENPTTDDPPRFETACRYQIEIVRIRTEVAP